MESPLGTQAPRIRFSSEGLSSWMQEEALTLFVSTYQHDCLIVLSASGSDELRITGYPFDRPMGMTLSLTSFRIATRQHIWEFENLNPIETSSRSPGDSIYRLDRVTPTGFLDAHDLAQSKDGSSILVDTHHSCLREIDSSGNAIPFWQPEFISALAAEDRCHLNGVATEDGQARYATVVSDSDNEEGWRENRRNGGQLIDVENNRVVAGNLSMPHSPRLYRDRIWVLNAGTGEFGFVDPAQGGFHSIAFCPGFLRGLAFHEDYAIIGLSQARHNGKFSGLDLGESLDQRSESAICGLMVVNIETHKICHSLEFDAPIAELFDVQAVTHIGHPTLLKCQTLE